MFRLDLPDSDMVFISLLALVCMGFTISHMVTFGGRVEDRYMMARHAMSSAQELASDDATTVDRVRINCDGHCAATLIVSGADNEIFTLKVAEGHRFWGEFASMQSGTRVRFRFIGWMNGFYDPGNMASYLAPESNRVFETLNELGAG